MHDAILKVSESVQGLWWDRGGARARRSLPTAIQGPAQGFVVEGLTDSPVSLVWQVCSPGHGAETSPPSLLRWCLSYGFIVPITFI